MLEHGSVAECAVLGLPDDVYGESIAALVRLKTPAATAEARALIAADIRKKCLEFLPSYKAPTQFKFVVDIPKNAMGKVNKKSLKSGWSTIAECG